VLPPISLLLAAAFWRRLGRRERLRWAPLGLLALALPTGLLAFQLHECAKLNGDVAVRQWLPKGAPSVMRWRDILSLQKSDLKILDAPEYLRGELYGFRKYSYLGLLHVASFTDVLGYFQPPPASVSTAWSERTEGPFARERTALSRALQVGSVRLCLIYTLLAIAGTLFCLVAGGLSLGLRRPLLADANVVLAALAAGYYSVIFFSLHRLGDPYTPGFWLPRLVLPALVVFLALGFVLLDVLCRPLERRPAILRTFLFVCGGYTLVACLCFVGFLV